MNLNSIELLPYVGKRDKKQLAALRLKRWHARVWMRENNVRDLGITTRLPKLQDV